MTIESIVILFLCSIAGFAAVWGHFKARKLEALERELNVKEERERVQIVLEKVSDEVKNASLESLVSQSNALYSDESSAAADLKRKR